MISTRLVPEALIACILLSLLASSISPASGNNEYEDFRGWWVDGNQVSEANKGESVTGKVYLSGLDSGKKYRLRVMRDQSLWDDEVKSAEFWGSNGERSLIFTASLATGEWNLVNLVNGYHMDLYRRDRICVIVCWDSWNEVWTLGNSYPPRLRVREFDFTITATPSSRTVTPGQSTSYSVAARLSSGSSRQVSLSLEMIGSVGSGSFNRQSGNPDFTSTLTINTLSGAPTGTYSLTITGTGGGKSKSTSVSLVVNPPPSLRVTVSANPSTVISGNASILTATATASDGGRPSVSYTWTANGGSLSSTTSNPVTWRAPAVSSPTNYRVSVTISASGYTSSSGYVDVLIQPRVKSAQIDSISTDRSQYNIGETVRVPFTIRNTGNVRLDLRMVVNIKDPNDNMAYDSNPSGQDKRYGLNPGARESGEFTWIIPTNAPSGTYKVEASLREWGNWNTIYDYRWGNKPGPTFEGPPPLGSLNVRVRNIPGYDLPGSGGRIDVYLWYESYGNYKGSGFTTFSGGETYVAVTFPDLEPGNYMIEVWQTPNVGLEKKELWGADSSINVEGGPTTSYDFYRHTQVFSGIDPIGQANDVITPQVSVTNYESYEKRTWVELIIDKDRSPPYDYDELSSKTIIPIGEKMTFTLPSFQGEGEYFYYIIVYGEYGENGEAIVDQGVWGSEPSLTIVLTQKSFKSPPYSTEIWGFFKPTGSVLYVPKLDASADKETGKGSASIGAEIAVVGGGEVYSWFGFNDSWTAPADGVYEFTMKWNIQGEVFLLDFPLLAGPIGIWVDTATLVSEEDTKGYVSIHPWLSKRQSVDAPFSRVETVFAEERKGQWFGATFNFDEIVDAKFSIPAKKGVTYYWRTEVVARLFTLMCCIWGASGGGIDMEGNLAGVSISPVKPILADMTVLPFSPEAGDILTNSPLRLVAKVASYGYPLESATVDFYVNDMNVGSALTDSSGYASVDFIPPSTGYYSWYFSTEKQGYEKSSSITSFFMFMHSVAFYINPQVGSVAISDKDYTSGENGNYLADTYSATANPPLGFRLEFWEYSGSRKSGVYIPNININPTTVEVRGNGWIKVVFSAQITFRTSPNNIGSILYEGNTYTDGQIIWEIDLAPDFDNTDIIEARVPEGYEFAGWITTGDLYVTDSSANPTTLTVNGPGTVTANFQPKGPEIIFEQRGLGGDVTENILTVDGKRYTLDQLPISFTWETGSTHTFTWESPLTVSSDKQYVWTSTTGLTDGRSGTITVSESGKVTGNYQKQYYVEIQASPPEGGTVAPQSDWFDSGSQVRIAATEAFLFTFTSWSVTGDIILTSSTDNPTTVTINGPGTITANFETTPGPVFTLNVDKVSYSPGELVIISGTAQSGNYVAIEVRNPEGTIIFIDTPRLIFLAIVGSEGTYGTSFTLPNDAESGTYTVFASNEGQVRSVTFSVEKIEPQGLNVNEEPRFNVPEVDIKAVYAPTSPRVPETIPMSSSTSKNC